MNNKLSLKRNLKKLMPQLYFLSLHSPEFVIYFHIKNAVQHPCSKGLICFTVFPFQCSPSLIVYSKVEFVSQAGFTFYPTKQITHAPAISRPLCPSVPHTVHCGGGVCFAL